MCGKRLAVAKLAPLEELSTSSRVCGSSPALRPATMTSLVAARLTALRKLLSSLAECPAPGPPRWKIFVANVSSCGRIRSSASGSPPAMSVSVPFSAAAAPPETPASR